MTKFSSTDLARRFRIPARLLLLSLAALLASGWLATTAESQPFRTWTGNSSGNWSNPNNWNPVGAPQNGEILVFNNGNNNSMNNDVANLTISGLDFDNNDSDWTINGNTLTITPYTGESLSYIQSLGGSDCSIIINCNLILGGDLEVDVGEGTDGLLDGDRTKYMHLNGVINLSGHNLTLQPLTFTFVNGFGTTYTDPGNMYMDGQIVGLGNVNAYSDTDCYVEFGGTTGNLFQGELHVYGLGAQTFYFGKQSGVVVNTSLYLDEATTLNLSGANQIGSNAIVTLIAGAQLLLNGHNNSCGSLVMTNYHADATGCTVDASGATLTLTSGVQTSSDNDHAFPTIKGTLNLPGGFHTFDINNTAYVGLDMQATITGSGELTKIGNASLQLDVSNSLSGVIDVDAGPIDVYDPHGLGTTAGVTYLTDTGSLILHGISVAGEQLVVQGQGSGSFDTGGSVLTTIGTCGWSGSITLNTNLIVVADNTSLTGQITGSGGMEFLVGTAVLGGSSANTFTGTTHAENELLEFSKPAGVAAFSGPLIVGTGVGAAEARWLNNFQGVSPAVTVFANSLVNLTNHSDTFSALTYTGGDVETGTGQLTLPATVTSLAASSTALLNGKVLISGSGLTFNIADGGAHPDLSVGAAISDSSIVPVTKLGLGELALTASNTYRGSTFIGGGLVMALDDYALGSATVGTVVSNGATLEVDGRSQNFSEGLNLSGAGRGGTNGALYCLSSSTISSPIFLVAPSTIRSDETGSDFLLLSTIIGTGPLTTIGVGRIELAGSQNNTYTGDTDATQGTLWLAKTGGAYAIPNNLVIGDPDLFGTSATAVSFSFYQVNGSTVTVNGGSEWDLQNVDEIINELLLNSGGAVHTTGGSLFLAGVSGTVISVNTGLAGNSVITGRLNLTGAGTFLIGSQGIFGSGPPLDIQATIGSSSTGALTKSGPGEMRFSASNSFTGNVLVNQGTLSLLNNLALGAGSGTTTVNTNGTLELLNGLTISNESLTLNSASSPALWCSSGSNNWNGTIALNQTAIIDIDPAGGYLQISNIVSGAGGLTKTGLGTLQFTGTVSNGYAGPTTIQSGFISANRAGVVSIPSDVFIGNDFTTNISATLTSMRDAQLNRLINMTIHSSGELSLQAVGGTTAPDEHVATLNGKGLVNMFGAGSRLVVTNETPCDFYGSVTGDGTFSKNGSSVMTMWGNWTLNPSANSSALEIFEGDFVVNGTITSGTNEVMAGARLRGGGRIIGPVGVDHLGEIGAGSKIPGQQGGVLEMSSLSLTSLTTNFLNFYGPSSNGGNDGLMVDGTVTLAGATLAAAFHYPPHNGDVITLVNKTSSGFLNSFGNFNNGVRKIGDYFVLASYTGGDGNDLTITVTNGPVDYFSYRLAEGNGNQTVEPNECDLLYVSLVNLSGTSITITNAILRATNASGVVVTVPQATFPVIPSGQSMESLTPFQFRTDTNLVCGGSVGFELVVGIQNQGQYAVSFSPVSGNDCTHPTGPCQSCTMASGQFTANTPATALPLYFTGAPSTCFPGKAYPGTNPAPTMSSTPFLTHSFTNSTTNQLCITAQLGFTCPSAPTNALGVAAYLGNFDTNNPGTGYLGDIGAGGPPYPAFSFQVPAGTNFTLVVMAQATNLTCSSYSLELFGLPCPLPTLAITNETAPSKVRVNWSTAYPGFTAQQTGALKGGSFTNVTQSPVITNSRYALTNLTATSNQFYRLIK